MSGVVAATTYVEISNNNGFSFGDFMVIGTGIVGEAVVGNENSQSVTFSNPMAVDIRRGRERVLDTYNTGTASVTVADTNTWNPLWVTYDPNQFQQMNPGIQMKITAEYPTTALSMNGGSVHTNNVVGAYVPNVSKGSLDVRVAFVVTDGLDGQLATIASKGDSGAQISWIWFVRYGQLVLYLSLNGSTIYQNFISDPLPQFNVGTSVALRFYFDGNTGRVSFYYWVTSPVLAYDVVKSDASWTLINTVEDTVFTTAFIANSYQLWQSTSSLRIGSSVYWSAFKCNLLAFCLNTEDAEGSPTTKSSFDMSDGLKVLSTFPFQDDQLHYFNNLATISVASVNYSYPLFAGFISSFEWNWTKGVTGQNTVTFNAEDAFRALNMVEIETVTGANANDLPGTRINQVLTEVSYPTAGLSISTGQSFLQDDADTVRTVLPLLQAIAESDLGSLYVDKTGYVKFEDRETIGRRLLSPYIGFDDVSSSPNTYDFQMFNVVFDDDLITNDVSIDSGGDIQQVTDPTSIETYFKRSMSKTGLLMELDDDALSMAETILYSRKTPLVRISNIGFDITKVPNTKQGRLLSSVLGLEYGQPVGVSKNWYQTDPNAIGFNSTSFNTLLTVQGISHTIRPDRWVVELATSEPIISAAILDYNGFDILYY